MNQYLQIDLQKDHVITGVATQGRRGGGQWVTKYQLEYIDHGFSTWSYYQIDGTTKVRLALNISTLYGLDFFRVC